MVRTPVRLLLSTLAVVLVATAASAQTVHSVQLGVGGFFPRGLDGRADGDVLARNFFGEPMPADPTDTVVPPSSINQDPTPDRGPFRIAQSRVSIESW